MSLVLGFLHSKFNVSFALPLLDDAVTLLIEQSQRGGDPGHVVTCCSRKLYLDPHKSQAVIADSLHVDPELVLQVASEALLTTLE